jgi:steroid delta-isomerase-like uncharacterized protein
MGSRAAPFRSAVGSPRTGGTLVEIQSSSISSIRIVKDYIGCPSYVCLVPGAVAPGQLPRQNLPSTLDSATFVTRGNGGVLQKEMAEADLSLQRLERRRDLVRAHVDCENQHDFDGILQTFGTAVAYEDQAWRTRYPGSESVRLYYEEFLRASADLRIKVHAEHVCTETIILEVTISGTHTCSWHGLLATARRFEIPLCAVYSFDCDDQLAGERIYYDRATVFAQLGVFREPIGWFGRIALVLNHPLTIGRSVVRMVWK